MMSPFSHGVFICFQYTMLSGTAPFRGSSRDYSAAIIMDRIRSGEFSLSGEAFSTVSDQAKKIIKGE